MMISPDIESYAEQHSKPESIVLQKLYRETHLKVIHPRMLSGQLQGKLLQFMSQMIKPKNILEIGTFTGYSAICLSEGLIENGIIHTIEINYELEDIARKYFEEASTTNKTKLYIGNAIDIIPTLEETFDLVFIDADKENYRKYYDLVFNKVRKGGFIIADNVLWSGKVLEEPHHNDKDTIEIIAFNKMVLQDERVDNLLLPFRDGLMIIRKK
ncbi:MAG: methyltransferase [Bacteroidetes bacterium CG2_30_32_10]|nr:MAG: methyltransferase [Bacteroidetes bacterium CG2_30_32_10]